MACGSEKWRSRPFEIVAAPRMIGLARACRGCRPAPRPTPSCARRAARPAGCRGSRRRARAARSAGRSGGRRRPSRAACRRRPGAGDRAAAPRRSSAEPDRAVVAHAVVEEREVDAVGDDLGPQLVRVAQLAEDAERTRSTTAVVNGEKPGLQRADVRVERRVGEAEAQVRVGLRRHRDAPRPRDREPGRRRLEHVDRAASRRARVSARRHLARCPRRRRTGRRCARAPRSAARRTCPFPTAVKNSSPESGACGIGDARPRSSIGIAARVGVERVGAVPADVGGAGDAPGALARSRWRRCGTPSPSKRQPGASPRRTARRTRRRRRSSSGRSPAAPRTCRRGGTRRTARPSPGSRRAEGVAEVRRATG